MFKEQELVYDIDDEKPIIYIIEKIKEKTCYLKGLNHRIYKVTNIEKIDYATDKLKEQEENICNQYNRNMLKTSKTRNNKILYGRILHIDGDEEYLSNCLELYNKMKMPVEGIYINEKDMENEIERHLLDITPDVVVITGHDFYNGKGKKDLNNYENSSHFVETIRKIRKHFNFDDVTIIVGACCSHFEALLGAGANIASSPDRINIHTYDPAIIAIKVASTSCNRIIDFESVLNNIENKRSAFGGIETKGKMRILM